MCICTTRIAHVRLSIGGLMGQRLHSAKIATYIAIDATDSEEQSIE